MNAPTLARSTTPVHRPSAGGGRALPALVLALALTLPAVAQTVTAPAKEQAAPAATAASPVEATPELVSMVTREMEATVKAFNAADAAALAKLFAEKGELVDENGNVYAGQAEITALFKAFFEKYPKAQLGMEVLGVRAVGDALAVEEGIREIVADDGATAARVRYVAVRSKAGDRWPIATYSEYADEPPATPRDMLAPLEFLVGDWIDESPAGTTEVSYRWSEDGNFLLGEYVLAIGGEEASKSVQRIGWDPVEGTIRSWTFDADGGFSAGEWTPVEDGWVIRTEAVMPDGTTAAANVTVALKDADHFVVRSTDRIVAGAAEPDFELAIARKPPQPGAVPAKPAPTPAPAAKPAN